MNIPSCSGRPERSIFLIGSELRRTVDTYRNIRKITIVIAIVTIGKETDSTRLTFRTGRFCFFFILDSKSRIGITVIRKTGHNKSMWVIIILGHFQTGTSINNVFFIHQSVIIQGHISIITKTRSICHRQITSFSNRQIFLYPAFTIVGRFQKLGTEGWLINFTTGFSFYDSHLAFQT